MNNQRPILIVAVVVVALFGIFAFVDVFQCMNLCAPKPTDDIFNIPESAKLSSYHSDEYGISFSYLKSYYLHEIAAPGMNTTERPAKSIMLVADTKENRDVLDGKSTEPREGPISMTIDIYPNIGKLSASAWARQDPLWNMSDKHTDETAVGGKEGVSFTWDGLYRGRTTIVTTDAFAYVFTVTWMDLSDAIIMDQEKLLSSVKFIQ